MPVKNDGQYMYMLSSKVTTISRHGITKARDQV